MAVSPAERILQLAREKGVLRSRDLEAHGLQRVYLRRLCDQGALERSGRGIYYLPDAEITEFHTFAEAATRVPNGVLCLLSALRYHDLTTENPREIWMAIDPKSHRPRCDYPPLRIARFSGRALTEGVEERRIEGARVRIYGVAKTIVDCFKYRNKIGIDAALEAMKDAWRARRITADELWNYAVIRGVGKSMRPYMEALIS